MDQPTLNQKYHLILADVAMAMAAATVEGIPIPLPPDYQPGAVRDDWLAAEHDPFLRRRVLALASAAMGSLQEMSGDRLHGEAQRFGVPLAADEAAAVSAHFTARRERVLTYRR